MFNDFESSNALTLIREKLADNITDTKIRKKNQADIADIVRTNSSGGNVFFSSFDWKMWAQQDENKFLFLHVGKAAGSSIFCELTLPRSENFRQKYWCSGMQPTDEKKKIPLYSQKYGERLHMRKIKDRMVYEYNVFLFSLRNPVNRIISAYEYEKNHKWVQRSFPDFKECFPNSVLIEDFLTNLGNNVASVALKELHGMNSSAYCRQVATNVVKGMVHKYQSHMTYNYQFYEDQFLYAAQHNKTKYTNHHILAVRSEFLQDDFENLELFFRTGEVVVNNNTSVTNTANKKSDSGSKVKVFNAGNIRNKERSISSGAYMILCRLLCKDIQSFKRVLFRAENLSKEMVLDSMKNLNQFCPMEKPDINEHCEETTYKM